MTRTRKLTLSVKEFSHLVSESLDITNGTSVPQSFIENTTVLSEVPQRSNPTPSSFQRIFSRPTPGQRGDSPERTPEDRSEVPRKMIAWPFSRSLHRNRRARDEHNATNFKDPGVYHSVSPYSVTSAAATSTSSLGSLLPADEQFFRVTSQGSDGPSQRCNLFRVSTLSPGTALPSCAGEPPTCSGAISSDPCFGNESATSVLSGSSCNVVKPTSSVSNQSQTSLKATDDSHSVTTGESESVQNDPTPRASTFGSRAACLPTESWDPVLYHGKRSQHLSLVVPSRKVEVLSLRPAVGVAPHVPSETGSSVSLCSTSPPTSPIAWSSSPTFPAGEQSGSGAPSSNVPLSTPPDSRVPLGHRDNTLPANVESVPASGCSSRQRKQALSRSMTPPPLPRPPPTGPLPAVPSSVPPVPPLPPLLHKISMNVTPHLGIPSSRRSTIAGTPANPPSALPPSPPGGLRLPSRLSWVSSVRAVLPSPPASPTKSLRSLIGKNSGPSSPYKAEKQRSRELKRPTSISVIEAADNAQVRRTKSILLLGSRSKSNVSLRTKRVQIHADVSADAGESRKPRPKSSVATIGHPIYSSDSGMITPMPSSEILVPRERRHSAPMLSSISSKVSADWTLSLPFCTDVPGSKLLLSPLSTPQLEPERGLEEVQGEDWTLCMPLNVRVNTPTVETSEEATEGRDSVCTPTETSEGAEVQTAVQLPTPCPSPTWSTPSSVVRPLDPEESTATPVDRPTSPASLGPHVGGLDLAGGCGKRASGWHVYGWFDEVSAPEDEREVSSMPVAVPDSKSAKSHVAAFKNMYDANGRNPSQDSTSTMSTSETIYYSARSSLLTS